MATTFELISTVDITNMVRDELAPIASQVFSTVNKRISRIINSDVISPAYEALQRKRGDVYFHVGGKDLDELIQEYSEAVAFYNMPTGTVSGARPFTNNLKNMLGDRIDDKHYIASVFDMLHGIEDRLPIYLAQNMVGSEEILNRIIEENIDVSDWDLESMSAEQEAELSMMVQELIDAYEEQQKQMEEEIDGMNGLSGWLF